MRRNGKFPSLNEINFSRIPQYNLDIYIEKMLRNTRKIESGCWIWGTSTQYEIPRECRIVRFFGHSGTVHSLSYLLHYGNYDVHGDGELFVCHTCDNPTCVNPDHLCLNTRKGNMKAKRAVKWRGAVKVEGTSESDELTITFKGGAE